MSSIAVRIDTLRSLAYSSILTATYTLVTSGLTHKTRVMKFTNNTDGDMFFAFTSTNVAPSGNGTADNIFVPAGGFTLFDFSANPSESGEPFVFSVNTYCWVRYSTAPTRGSVYIECVYGKGE
jgi:hypothetical protein